MGRLSAYIQYVTGPTYSASIIFYSINCELFAYIYIVLVDGRAQCDIILI